MMASKRRCKMDLLSLSFVSKNIYNSKIFLKVFSQILLGRQTTRFYYLYDTLGQVYSIHCSFTDLWGKQTCTKNFWRRDRNWIKPISLSFGKSFETLGWFLKITICYDVKSSETVDGREFDHFKIAQESLKSYFLVCRIYQLRQKWERIYDSALCILALEAIMPSCIHKGNCKSFTLFLETKLFTLVEQIHWINVVYGYRSYTLCILCCYFSVVIPLNSKTSNVLTREGSLPYGINRTKRAQNFVTRPASNAIRRRIKVRRTGE